MEKMMNKKTLAIVAAAAALLTFPLFAAAEDKLVVQDASQNNVFAVGDNGSLSINGQDTNNTFTYELGGHTGGANHLQITTGSSDSRVTLIAGDPADQAPRFQAIAAQDTNGGNPTAARGWAIFDYGSYLYSLPNAEFKVRNIYFDGTSPIFTDMIRMISNTSVVFPNGNVTIGSLAGSYTNGSAYVCVNNSGQIYASETACP